MGAFLTSLRLSDAATLESLAAAVGRCQADASPPSVRLPPFLRSVYGEGGERSAQCAAGLLQKACEELSRSFSLPGSAEVQVIRSPARVNLRGMHIDNNGGYTNSICVNREVFIVFTSVPRAAKEPVARLVNCSADFTPKEVQAYPGVDETTVKSEPGWAKYVAGAIAAAESVIGVTSWPRALHGVIVNSCPAGVGLSSSHAFVICVLRALLEVAGISRNLDSVLELRAAQKAEHLAGVKSGLMDQGSMIFGQQGEILHARFYDLKMEEIPQTVQTCPWPAGCSVVVANSKVVRQLAVGDNAVQYALPRLGCAIALPILRQAAQTRGLKADEELSWGLENTLALLKVVPAAATLFELFQAFPSRKADIQAAVDRFIPGGQEGLGSVPIPLRGSTLFVLAESARAKDFFAALKAGDLALCGQLMDIGHEGDDPNGDMIMPDQLLDKLAADFKGQSLSFIPGAFKAGHPRLDELCKALKQLGAHGASLTGAGRGGCVVGLFPTTDKADFAAEALSHLFPDLQFGKDVFVASPIEGRRFLDLSPRGLGETRSNSIWSELQRLLQPRAGLCY